MPSIHLSGEIGWFPNRAEYVREQIAASPDGEPVRVIIDSIGGDAFEGMAIHSLLKNCGRKVVTEIGSVAASSASLIFVAGNERIMPEGTVLMVHNVSVWNTEGEGDDLRKTADMLDKISGEYAKLYAAATGATVEKAQALMDAETWLDSAEAVKIGFATTQATAAVEARLAARANLSRFAASAGGRFRNAPVSIFKQQHPLAMNKELLASLGLTADATAEQIDGAVKTVLAAHATLKAEAEAAKLKAEADAHAAATTEAEAAVTDAIASGALTEEDRAETVTAYLADKPGTARLLAKLNALSTAKPDGHAGPLKISASGGVVSAEAFAAAASATADGEPRAALYREHPQFLPKASGDKARFAKASPVTARALGIIK